MDQNKSAFLFSISYCNIFRILQKIINIYQIKDYKTSQRKYFPNETTSVDTLSTTTCLLITYIRDAKYQLQLILFKPRLVSI